MNQSQAERDLMRQVDVVSNLISLFDTKQCVADLGYGAVQVAERSWKFTLRNSAGVGC